MPFDYRKLPSAIGVANDRAHHCLNRADFFAGKSRASYAKKATENWQAYGETWADVEELLRELAQYRNATRGAYPEIVERVAEGMRAQGYDYESATMPTLITSPQPL